MKTVEMKTDFSSAWPSRITNRANAMDTADIMIIGAGAVGLAVACEAARCFAGASIIVLERQDSFGRETSSRNSEVIHAGIYYPEGSLKAQLCVGGNRLLYEFCRARRIACKRISKLIVAPEEKDIAVLHSLLERGKKNGVSDLELLDADRVRRCEPNIRAAAAILSPSTGIIDSHGLMARMEQIARERGAAVAYRHEVHAVECSPKGIDVVCRLPSGRSSAARCRVVVNCAGLSADRVAAAAGIDIERSGYRLFPCKGEYFRIPPSKAGLIQHLIYPPPYADLRGLGVHVTKTLDGQVRLGPNAFYVDTPDYSVDPDHAQEFYDGARSFLPFLAPDDLQPDTAGIRPKLQAPGTPIRDFVIRHESDRGLRGFINLLGIESPGLTACLAIAQHVRELIAEAL